MESLGAHLSKQQLTGDFSLTVGEVLDFPFKKIIFSDAHVMGGSLTCSLFEDCTFVNTTFENIYMDHVDFERCHFDGVKFINCSHDGMEIRECTGSVPTMIGSKASSPGSENQKPPPGWETYTVK